MPTSFKWSLPFRFSNQKIVHISHLSHACHVTRPFHSTWCDHPNNIRWRVQVIKFSLCSLLQPPATSPFLGPHSFLSNLFSNTVNLCFLM
jgi:hypothetical protein